MKKWFVFLLVLIGGGVLSQSNTEPFYGKRFFNALALVVGYKEMPCTSTIGLTKFCAELNSEVKIVDFQSNWSKFAKETAIKTGYEYQESKTWNENNSLSFYLDGQWFSVNVKTYNVSVITLSIGDAPDKSLNLPIEYAIPNLGIAWLKPTSDTQSNVCKYAYLNYIIGMPTYFKAFLESGNVTFQSPLGSIWNVCRNAAKSLQRQPSNLPLIALLYVYGEVRNLADAEKWRTALVFYGSDDVELGRLFFSEGSTISSQKNWEPDCKKSPCVWKGQNIYRFDLSTFKEIDYSKVAYVKVLIGQRKSIIEEFKIENTLR